MVEPPAPQTPAPAADDPPPVLGRWRNVYVALLAELILLVALFYALARWAQ